MGGATCDGMVAIVQMKLATGKYCIIQCIVRIHVYVHPPHDHKMSGKT